MRVLLLTRYSRMGASSRLRSLQYVDVLSDLGVEFEVRALLDDAYLRTIYRKEKVSTVSLMQAYGQRLRLLMQAGQFDVVWIEKELFPNWPGWFEWLLAKMNIRYIVDYDDAIFHNYDMARNPLKRVLKNKIGKVMQHASLVVGGNSYLLQHARQSGASRVALLPTVIDLRRYRVAPTRANGERLVVGWIGSPSTVRYIQALLPVLARLAKRHPIEFVVVGARIEDSRYEFIRCEEWTEDSEVAHIEQFDVGVMPLPDGPFERGKCGYKIVQYMACGKPAVASPVGVNADIVRDGVNGFLARSDDEWFAALDALLSDSAARAEMGRRGRKIVEDEYCLQVTAPRMLQLLYSVLHSQASATAV